MDVKGHATAILGDYLFTLGGKKDKLQNWIICYDTVNACISEPLLQVNDLNQEYTIGPRGGTFADS